MMEEAARLQADAQNPVALTHDTNTPVAPSVAATPVTLSSGPIPFVETQPTNSSGPIPFIEKTPTGSTVAITAPDVAILTPIDAPIKPRRGHRVRSSRDAVVRKVRLRPEGQKRKALGFVPRAGRAIRRAARETWSTAIRGFVVLVIGAFMVTLTLPSTGFHLALPGYAATETGVHQEVTTASNTDVATAVNLGEFTISNYGDLLALRYGTGNWGYTVSNKGPIRWPFPYAAPISSGYGARVAPCPTCSTYHEGLDFNPSEGAPIYAIADGVVVEKDNAQWGYGVWVLIRHKVGKLSFDSGYAHMERGSTELKVGDEVKVGDYVGRVGNTGTSTGAHLHLEIRVDGAQVDPFAWLKEHAK